MLNESSQYRAFSIILLGLDAMELFCTATFMPSNVFYFPLQQRKLVLSQISLVTTATASQPGGNVMVKKNVLMDQMNQKQHAVSSAEK